MASELKVDQLKRVCDPKRFKFETTAELESHTRIIGQPRGTLAIEFGINVDSPGYNIYVLGESGTGRTTAITRFIEKHAEDDPVPSDWAYVHNFQDPQKPIALKLPSGRGCELRDSLEEAIEKLRSEIPKAFDSQAYRDAVLEVQHGLNEKREELFTDMQNLAVEMGATLLATPEGFRLVPARDGKPLTPEELSQLSEEDQSSWKEVSQSLEHKLNQTIHEARMLESGAQEKVDDLIRRVASSVVDVIINEIRDSFKEIEDVQEYLDQIYDDVLDNAKLFQADSKSGEVDAGKPGAVHLRRYQVNVIVDHKLSKGAPVLLEHNPSIPGLLGRVEHEVRHGGAIVTDFTLLRSGALHAANGGFLVIRARDLFTTPETWEMLKRTLVGGEVVPDDFATRRGTATRTLNPEAIPLDLKVILIGPPVLYYLLHELDDDFSTLFKVMADFDDLMERSPENEMEYATFIATRCHEEGLIHFDPEAVAKVIEFGSRRAASQSKLSTQFGAIADIVREASYWAEMQSREVVCADDVQKAIDQREYLHNRIENRLKENLFEGKKLIATEGEVSGQVNGLSVSIIGEHSFGQPSRVTARTYAGKEGVVQIDREVELAGPIHNKGVLTLIGYLGGKYADSQPLSLSALITFEQNYTGIEGDSASSTELYALISSLADVPINQSIAVTGSVNQLGEIQAIGGVTEKVEGWYEVCEKRGLNGKQGVMIPASNIPDLMVKSKVIEAVSKGDFHIWSIETVDEGLLLLTGNRADQIHDAARARLKELAEIVTRYKETD